MLYCAAPAHPRTISLRGMTLHNNYAELEFVSPQGAFPEQRNHTITCTPEYIYISHNSESHLFIK